MLDLVLAVLAGVVTIAAPCTLPVLPVLLGASIGQTNRLRPALIAAGFVLSFSVVALALSALTRALDLDPDILEHHSTLGTQIQEQTITDRAAFHLYLAKAYAERGVNQRALLYLRKALEEGVKDRRKILHWKTI